MRIIKSYESYVSESIISKAKELFNFRQISENDKIAKKYIDMIYKDWNKNKNLLKSFISISDDSTTFKYLISDNESDICGTGTSEEHILIQLILIKDISNWQSDTSRARISAKIFKPYIGSKELFGRDIKTDKIIINDNGIDGDVYSYINISHNQVSKIIDFFKSEFIKKYPVLSTSKYFDESFGIELSDKYIEYSLKNLGQSKNIKVIKGDLLSRETYKQIPQKPTFVYSYLPFTGRSTYAKSSNISEQSIRMNKMFDIVYDYFPSGSIFFFKSWSYKKNNEMNITNKDVSFLNFSYQEFGFRENEVMMLKK